MDSSSEWFLYSGRSQFITLNEQDLFDHRNFGRTVLVIDLPQLDYFKGMCFIYGKQPLHFFTILQGHAVRLEPTREWPLFAYQYNPADLHLEYTRFTPMRDE